MTLWETEKFSLLWNKISKLKILGLKSHLENEKRTKKKSRIQARILFWASTHPRAEVIKFLLHTYCFHQLQKSTHAYTESMKG